MDIPSGVVSHVQLQGVTANEHHNQLHAAEHLLVGGDPLGAAFRQDLRKIKTVNQSFTNTITLANDADLSFAVKGGVRYGFELHAYINAPPTGGIQCKLSLPNGAAGRITSVMSGTSGYQSLPDMFGGTFIANIAAIDGVSWIHLWGIIVPTADDTAQVQWAQSVANASATIILANSHAMMYPW